MTDTNTILDVISASKDLLFAWQNNAPVTESVTKLSNALVNSSCDGSGTHVGTGVHILSVASSLTHAWLDNQKVGGLLDDLEASIHDYEDYQKRQDLAKSYIEPIKHQRMYQVGANITKQKNDNKFSREQIIALALESAEGRTALAQAMVEPIKASLMYQGIGRKLLMVDELRQGSLPRYERDIAVKSYVIPKRGANPVSIVEAEELLVPMTEIASNPTININEIKERRYYIVDRAQVRSAESIQRQEDTEVFKLLNAAVPPDHTITAAGALQPETINLAMALIEEHGLFASTLVMNPRRYKDIRTWDKDFFDEETQDASYGHIWSADVHVSEMCPRDTVYALAPPQFVGVMPVRQDITVLPANDPKRLRLGWVVFEELGMAIINDYAISKITVIGEHNKEYAQLKPRAILDKVQESLNNKPLNVPVENMNDRIFVSCQELLKAWQRNEKMSDSFEKLASELTRIPYNGKNPEYVKVAIILLDTWKCGDKIGMLLDELEGCMKEYVAEGRDVGRK